MDCEVRDLMADFEAYWSAAADQPLERRAALWRDLYESPHPDVFDHYFGLWGSRDELLESGLRQHEGKELVRRGTRLTSAVGPGASLSVELLGARSVPLRYVVMVGLFRADGWVDDLRGQPTAFFCVEKLADPDTYAAMVAHETTHILHQAQRPGSWPDEAVGLNLLVEGLALAAAQQADPGLSPGQLFGVDDFGAWRADCCSAWPEVLRELLNRLEEVDCDQYRRFFWPDWIRRDVDVPERIGYLVGYSAVQTLAERHSLEEMVRWPPERAIFELRPVLNAPMKVQSP